MKTAANDGSVCFTHICHIYNIWKFLAYTECIMTSFDIDMQCIMGKLNIYANTKKEVKSTQIK
jgi:hypothetical protein